MDSRLKKILDAQAAEAKLMSNIDVVSAASSSAHLCSSQEKRKWKVQQKVNKLILFVLSAVQPASLAQEFKQDVAAESNPMEAFSKARCWIEANLAHNEDLVLKLQHDFPELGLRHTRKKGAKKLPPSSDLRPASVEHEGKNSEHKGEAETPCGIDAEDEEEEGEEVVSKKKGKEAPSPVVEDFDFKCAQRFLPELQPSLLQIQKQHAGITCKTADGLFRSARSFCFHSI